MRVAMSGTGSRYWVYKVLGGRGGNDDNEEGESLRK